MYPKKVAKKPSDTEIKPFDDNWMVLNGLRYPRLDIDRSCFKKTDKEKQDLIDAKLNDGKIKTISFQIVSPDTYRSFKQKFYDRRNRTR
jgi:hypothetical protein